MSNDLSSTSSTSNWKETEFPKIKDRIFELLVQLTQTDLRMSDSQEKAFWKCYWDLVKQEPSLEEMDLAYRSYIAHFDHIPSAFAYVKHFNRFRSGIMPNKKGTTLKKLEQQQADLKMEQWIKQMEDQNEG